MLVSQKGGCAPPRPLDGPPPASGMHTLISTLYFHSRLFIQGVHELPMENLRILAPPTAHSTGESYFILWPLEGSLQAQKHASISFIPFYVQTTYKR
jgi:hypothetical protein